MDALVTRSVQNFIEVTMKKVGTVLGKYNTFVVIALQSYETVIGHESVNEISKIQIMDVVEFDYVGLSVSNCTILRRENNGKINDMLIKLAETPVLQEVKLEDAILSILKGEKLDLNIVGVRTFKGGTRIILKNNA